MGDQWDEPDRIWRESLNSNRYGAKLMADYSDAYRDNPYPVKSMDSNISVAARPMVKGGIHNDLSTLANLVAKTEDAIAGLRADLDFVLRAPQEKSVPDDNTVSLASTERSDVSKSIVDLTERVNWILKKIDYIRANIDL